MLMLCIHNYAPQDKKILSQLGLAFAVICAAILSIHYYIQLTIVQQGLLNNQTAGLWLLATPNPHSLFWTFAALGYGFMGFALLCAAPVFKERSERNIKLLFIANGFVGIGFLIGNALGMFVVNILASFVWGVLFPIAALLVAKKFRNSKPDTVILEPRSSPD
jgi:MFS family permease